MYLIHTFILHYTRINYKFKLILGKLTRISTQRFISLLRRKFNFKRKNLGFR
jgi:hypothetical protein